MANENTPEQCEIIETELNEVLGGIMPIPQPPSKCGIGNPLPVPMPSPFPLPLPRPLTPNPQTKRLLDAAREAATG